MVLGLSTDALPSPPSFSGPPVYGCGWLSCLCVCLDVKLMNAGTCRSVDPYVGVVVIVYTLLMGSV